MLHSSSKESDVQIRCQYLPQSIRGDLDSVRDDVRDFYASKGVEITDLAADQDSTDLQKCLLAVEEVTKFQDRDLRACSILAVGQPLPSNAHDVCHCKLAEIDMALSYRILIALLCTCPFIEPSVRS